MPDFPRKTLTISSTKHTYSYIHVVPSLPDKDTLIFFHGFPSIASSWQHQIKFFADLGHGIIAIDMLGFGSSSKPSAVQEYRSRPMVEDFVSILNHEKIVKYHGIGHDAGTYVLSRLYNYDPNRLLSMTFISTPYVPPATHFDVTAINGLMQKLVGFSKFGYVEFLAGDSSFQIVDSHLESFQSIAFHADMNVRAEHFYPPGRLKAWLEADQRDTNIILNSEESSAWLDAFRAGGFQGPTNFYRVMAQNLSESEEMDDLSAGRLTTKIEVPVLLVDAQPDKTSVPGMMEDATKQHASGMVVVKMIGSQGHYPHIVSRDEVNLALKDFLTNIAT